MENNAILEEINGYLHSIDTLSGIDGEGLRTVFFLAGCNVGCKFCHNPDTWASGDNIVTVKYLVDIAVRNKPYFGCKGGVTLSGGEPLYQPVFVSKLIDELHFAGVKVALDTSGAIFNEEILAKTDLVLLDAKSTDSEGFMRLTNGKIDTLYQCIEFLEREKKRFWLRQVIIEGENDNMDNIARLALLGRLAEKIELLPYHTMGQAKWEKLGKVCPISAGATSVKTIETLYKMLNDITKK